VTALALHDGATQANTGARGKPIAAPVEQRGPPLNPCAPRLEKRAAEVEQCGSPMEQYVAPMEHRALTLDTMARATRLRPTAHGPSGAASMPSPADDER
jgi:hypothetical protein